MAIRRGATATPLDAVQGLRALGNADVRACVTWIIALHSTHASHSIDSAE
jgi:hypothetical protein